MVDWLPSIGRRELAKDARLMVRLDQADLDWIKEQGEQLGLDAATFVRSLIRQHRNGLVSAPQRAAEPDYEPDAFDPSSIDLDALADGPQREEAFPVAAPGDINAVRPVGARADRGQLLPSWRR